MKARLTGRGVKPFDTPENSQKEKCESLGSYTGTGFTSAFASFDFDTLDEQVWLKLYVDKTIKEGRCPSFRLI